MLSRVRAIVASTVAAAALVATAVVTGPVTATPAQAATRGGASPGLPWASGAYIPGDRTADHDSFGRWRGAATDVVVTWPARRTWTDIVNPSWLYSRWRTVPRTIVLGVPPFPEIRGATLGACARGAYDRRWRNFGRAIRASGLADRAVIRLGWEFNGDWYAWSAHSPRDFAACWRRVHRAAESTAPALRWDWNVNRGTSPMGIDPRTAYPGDRYVDIVGVDSYDGWPGATTEVGWAQHYAGRFGLKFWADFARAHGKKLSIPEWGIYPGTAWAGHNGGDNPRYVAYMFRFFAQQADILAYEAYFNEPASYYAGALELNPRAAAEYRRQVLARRT